MLFDIDDKKKVRSSYRTLNPRLEHGSGNLPSSFSVKILDALKYLDLYTLSQGVGIDPALTATAFFRCSEIDCEKTTVCDGLDSYEFYTM